MNTTRNFIRLQKTFGRRLQHHRYFGFSASRKCNEFALTNYRGYASKSIIWYFRQGDYRALAH